MKKQKSLIKIECYYGQKNGFQVIWIPERDGFIGNEEVKSFSRISAPNTQDTDTVIIIVKINKKIKD